MRGAGHNSGQRRTKGGECRPTGGAIAPERDSHVATQQFTYLLSPAFREAEFLRTGERLPNRLTAAVDTATVTEAARRGILVVEAAHLSYPAGYGYSSSDPAPLPDTATVRVSDGGSFSPPELQANAAVFGDRLTPEQAAALLETVAAHYPLIAEAKEGARVWQARANQVAAERQAQNAEAERQRRESARQREEEAERRTAARDAERAEWITANGSPLLRKAAAAGYDCQRQYVTERAALELPDFTVDFGGRAEWKSRSCPSEAALDEALALREQGHDAAVVWLTREAGEDAYGHEQREVIVITDYLYRYTAIK